MLLKSTDRVYFLKFKLSSASNKVAHTQRTAIFNERRIC